MIVGIHLTLLLIMQPKKTMKNTCENCVSFDPSRHENDKRTSHCGICSKFTEVVFKSDSKCKFFMIKTNPIDIPEFKKVDPKPVKVYKQLDLFI